MKDPVTHIERPHLPWRPDEHLTECRLDARSYPTWSWSEARTQARALGKTRFYMVACVTCIQTHERHARWEDNPVSAMAREVEGARYQPERHTQMRTELEAIAMLIEAHRDEFDELVGGLGATVSIQDARAARRLRNQW